MPGPWLPSPSPALVPRGCGVRPAGASRDHDTDRRTPWRRGSWARPSNGSDTAAITMPACSSGITPCWQVVDNFGPGDIVGRRSTRQRGHTTSLAAGNMPSGSLGDRPGCDPVELAAAPWTACTTPAPGSPDLLGRCQRPAPRRAGATADHPRVGRRAGCRVALPTWRGRHQLRRMTASSTVPAALRHRSSSPSSDSGDGFCWHRPVGVLGGAGEVPERGGLLRLLFGPAPEGAARACPA
jgi:hypothetical protein